MSQKQTKFDIQPQILSINEAAIYINRSTKTIRRMMDNGELPFTMIRKCKMIPIVALNKLITPKAS